MLSLCLRSVNFWTKSNDFYFLLSLRNSEAPGSSRNPLPGGLRSPEGRHRHQDLQLWSKDSAEHRLPWRHTLVPPGVPSQSQDRRRNDPKWRYTPQARLCSGRRSAEALLHRDGASSATKVVSRNFDRVRTFASQMARVSTRWNIIDAKFWVSLYKLWLL